MFAVELVEAELVAAVVVTVAKSAPLAVAQAARAAAEVQVVAQVLKCPPSLVLPRVARLDQYFAAAQPSLDSSR